MCKVLMLIGVHPDKNKDAINFIKKSVPFMSENDKDGAGYMAADGANLFGEKWLRNSDAFKTVKRDGKDQEKINTIFEHAVPNSFSRYGKFGEGELENATTFLFHTRHATCDKTIHNTHPFVIGDTGLIHNGVILNSDTLVEGTEQVSTCDSEAILQEYLKNEINADPEMIQDVADVLDGWYVAGLISKNKEGRQIVDVFKCNRSSLYVGWIPELDTFALCTEIGILKDTARAAGMTVSAYDTVSGGVFLRFDAVTGERLQMVDFEPEYKKEYAKSYSKYDSKYGSKFDSDIWGVDDDEPWEECPRKTG